MTTPGLDDLLVRFDMDEATFHAIAKDPGVILGAEKFLAVLLPKLDPFIRAGITAGATAGGALVPMPGLDVIVGLAGKLLGNAGLTKFEEFIAAAAAKDGA